MGSRTPEQNKRHYQDYQSRPDQIAKRSERNKARRLMEKKVGKEALKGKDVDHKTPIRSGGTNASGNLRVRSVAKNRGWESEKADK